MQLKQVSDLMDKQIAELEKASYMFDTVVRPRYEADKKILADLRAQSLKIGALMDKLNEGKEVTHEEVTLAVPPQFR